MKKEDIKTIDLIITLYNGKKIEINLNNYIKEEKPPTKIDISNIIHYDMYR